MILKTFLEDLADRAGVDASARFSAERRRRKLEEELKAAESKAVYIAYQEERIKGGNAETRKAAEEYTKLEDNECILLREAVDIAYEEEATEIETSTISHESVKLYAAALHGGFDVMEPGHTEEVNNLLNQIGFLNRRVSQLEMALGEFVEWATENGIDKDAIKDETVLRVYEAHKEEADKAAAESAEEIAKKEEVPF